MLPPWSGPGLGQGCCLSPEPLGMCWMGTCHSQWKSVSLQRPLLWQEGAWPTDSSPAIICLSPSPGSFGNGAGAQHVSGFGSMQEGPGPCDGDTPRSPTHPRSRDGFLGGRPPPQPGQGTGLAWGLVQPSGTLGMAGLGSILVLNPGHPPAMSPTQGGSSSPSKDPADPGPAISITRVPTPPAPEAAGTLSPWQDTGTGRCCCRTSICRALGLLGADL